VQDVYTLFLQAPVTLSRDLMVLTIKLTLPAIMSLKCFWLKVEHLDIIESSWDWAEQRFQIEILSKSEACSAYSGGAYTKKACNT